VEEKVKGAPGEGGADTLRRLRTILADKKGGVARGTLQAKAMFLFIEPWKKSGKK